MKEIEELKRSGTHWKPMAAATIVAVAGFIIFYTHQANQNEKLAQALSAANSKISLLASREKSLTAELDEAKNRAKSTNTERNNARDENIALTKKFSEAEEMAMTTERRLQESVSSLTSDLAASMARANTLAKALDPEKLREIDGPKASTQTENPLSKKSTAITRNKELLKKFIRVSDDFTRPKVYMHEYFEKRLRNTGNMKSFSRLINLKVNTAGAIERESFKLLQIIDGDEIVSFADLDLLHTFLKGRTFSEERIKCRLSWDELEINKDIQGYKDIRRYEISAKSPFIETPKSEDLTFDRDFAYALRETYELADNFKELNEFK
jgi:hypothetical protein